MQMNRTVGMVMVAAGVAVLLLAAAWLSGNEGLSREAGILGFGLASLFLALPLIGAGAFVLSQSGKEAQADARRRQQRKILDVVKTQGEVDFADMAVEIGASRAEAKNLLYDLVGKGLFAGYINWDEGMLYSAESRNLKALTNCKNCNGEIKVAGAGTFQCPYCGTEYMFD